MQKSLWSKTSPKLTVEWRDVARFSIQGLIFSPSHFSLFQEQPWEGRSSPRKVLVPPLVWRCVLRDRSLLDILTEVKWIDWTKKSCAKGSQNYKEKKLTFKVLSIRRLENDWKKITCSAHLLRQFCRHILASIRREATHDGQPTDRPTDNPTKPPNDRRTNWVTSKNFLFCGTLAKVWALILLLMGPIENFTLWILFRSSSSHSSARGATKSFSLKMEN